MEYKELCPFCMIDMKNVPADKVVYDLWHDPWHRECWDRACREKNTKNIDASRLEDWELEDRRQQEAAAKNWEAYCYHITKKGRS